jgi:hypothetical protein
MSRTIHVTVHALDPSLAEEVRTIADSGSAPEETKALAKAVLELNRSVHDLREVIRTIAESGALHVKRE